jgi:hypothetical protein
MHSLAKRLARHDSEAARQQTELRRSLSAQPQAGVALGPRCKPLPSLGQSRLSDERSSLKSSAGFPLGIVQLNRSGLVFRILDRIAFDQSLAVRKVLSLMTAFEKGSSVVRSCPFPACSSLMRCWYGSMFRWM